MVSNGWVRDGKSGWQRAHDSVVHLCRHRHSRLVLLAPCLFIFFMLLWSPSVHPGLSVKIQAHTQTSEQSHSPMRVSFLAAQDSIRVADVAADGFTVEAAAPVLSITRHHESTQSTVNSATQASELRQEASNKEELAYEPVGVLQQHLQNATAVAQKATAAAVQTLSLIQPALGLQANSTGNSSFFGDSPPSPSSSASIPDPTGSAQVHMGFNNKVVHDSFSSGNFASVNSTDVVPISEMPDVALPANTTQDWARVMEDDVSAGSRLPAVTKTAESSFASVSVTDSSGSASATTASASEDSTDLLGSSVDEFDMADGTQFAYEQTQSPNSPPSDSAQTESSSVPSRAEELSSAWMSYEEASPEVQSPHHEPVTQVESDWILVDPYLADLQGMIHPTSRIFRAPGKFPVTRDDLVAAMPTDERHFPIVESSKAWRKDMRTYVALSNETLAAKHAESASSQEIWGYYPDDKPLKGLHPGDTRAGLTPFLAHEAFEGDYKWILYGDDDTFFFVDGVLELLQDFDPSLPYFITDHYWWGDELNESMNYHPHERAPRCLPCHWTQEDEERSLRVDGYRPFQPYIGCPCTAERICKTDDRGFFSDACDMPVWKPETEGRDFRVYTMHGGAGALMSIGLMERLPLSFMDKCMKEMARSSGGDALISVCLWKAGYGFTDPGYSFYHWEAKSFDPGPENSTVLLTYLEDAISNNADQYSLELLSHVATSHLRSHNQGIGGTTQTMERLAVLYDNWRQRLQSVISTTQMHVGQHQKVMPAIQSTTGIADWRR